MPHRRSTFVSFEDPTRLKFDMIALDPEIEEAASRLGRCEDALHLQHAEVMAAHEQLVRSTVTQGELREAKVRTEEQVTELRLVLEYAEAARAAAAAAARDFAQAAAMQEDELRAAESKLHEHRAAEVRASTERRKLWERWMSRWLAIGSSKRIDVEGDVFGRLRELLLTEQREREAQSAYLAHAGAAELDGDVARAEARCAWLEAQIIALQQEHTSYHGQLSENIIRHLKGELEISNAHVVSLEREVQAVQTGQAQLDGEVDARAAARGAVLDVVVPPLLEQAVALKGELARRLDSLPVDHPSALYARQKALVAEAQEEARVERVEAERLDALLRAEKAAHDITTSQLDDKVMQMGMSENEFETKAQYQREMSQLESETEAAEAGHVERVREHEDAIATSQAKLDELNEELVGLRKQRQTMALSLAQYATLEYEWGEKAAAREVTIAKLEKANRRLRKHAKRAETLAALVSESSHDDVVRLKGEMEHMSTRIEFARRQVDEAVRERDASAQAVDDQRNDNSVSEWEMRERYAQREAEITAQAHRYKEDLGVRIVKQWILRTASKCFRAWSGIYVVARKARRELGAPDDSDDEDGHSRHQRLAQVVTSLTSSLTSQVSSQVSQLSAQVGNLNLGLGPRL